MSHGFPSGSPALPSSGALRRFLLRFVAIYAGLVLALALAVASYVVAHRDRIFPEPGTVVVYGRDSCGITTYMRTTLAERNVPFTYVNVDDGFLEDQEMLHAVTYVTHPDSDPSYVHFPVVRVAGQLLERPSSNDVLRLYQTARDVAP
ncbi:MAG: glutaredoxin domain-containing protein [Sinimarinibacterium sp.]|jgi:glutaredoxin